MRAPHIEFAPRPASGRMLNVAVLVAAGAVCAVTFWHLLESAREIERIDAEIHSATQTAERRRTASETAPGPSLPPAKINAINGAIARLNVPWSEVFAAFEKHKANDVALLALLPDARKRSLVVQAEAATPRAMVEFLELLRTVELLEDAYLLKHERRDQESGQPYRFSVEVHWKELP
ncbi:MAG: hypothetical protein EHM59_11285 [Betaproteobacteria bacterium]|nr:MAG: hypothetical protein EHM59_11285 [Betaproteobacteria bacterium]